MHLKQGSRVAFVGPSVLMQGNDCEYLKRNPPKKKTDEEKSSAPEGDPYL